MTQEKLDLGLPLLEAAKAAGVTVAPGEDATDHNVIVNGIRLHYLDWGNKKAQPMLLLHGGSQTAHTWDFVALAFRDKYHVIAPDLRGHGDSEWSLDGVYGTELNVKDVAGLVDTLELKGMVLMGLSMGGITSFAYTAAHPDTVKTLVIVDAGPEVKPFWSQRVAGLQAQPDEVDTYEEFVRRVKEFNPRRPIEAIRGALKYNVRLMANGKWMWKYDKRFRGSRPPETRRSEYLWDCMKNIKCPTLLVTAEESVVAEDVAKKMVEVVQAPARRVTVPKTGHLVMGDNPPGFEKVVKEFLATLK